MNKAWLVSSFLGMATLGVIAVTSKRHGSGYRFLEDAQPVASKDVRFRTNHHAHVDVFNLHDAWAQAELELCDKDGWRIGSHSVDCQNFNLRDRYTVCLVKGRLDDHQDFIPGTEKTDTSVYVRALTR